MKNPQLTMVLLAGVLLFSSCHEEIMTGKEPNPTKEHALEQRCCTDDVADNPYFQGYLDNLYTGLIEPSITLAEGFDSAYFVMLVENLVECIESGQNALVCLEGIPELLYVKSYLEGYQDFLLDSLRSDFDYLSDEDFFDSLSGAFAGQFGDDHDERRLPCFASYELDLSNAFMKMVEYATFNRPMAFTTFIREVGIARFKFCRCLYNTYGEGC